MKTVALAVTSFRAENSRPRCDTRNLAAEARPGRWGAFSEKRHFEPGDDWIVVAAKAREDQLLLKYNPSSNSQLCSARSFMLHEEGNFRIAETIVVQ